MNRYLRTDLLLGLLILAFTAVPAQLRLPHLHDVLAAFHLALYPVDVLANVLGYVPLGIALARYPVPRMLLVAAALSGFAEATQLCSAGRDPSIIDFLTNVAGAGIGWLLAAWTTWIRLPERLAITRRGAACAAVVAAAYVATGASFTVEAVMDRLGPWFATPPWVATNPRGAQAPGALEGHWSFGSSGRNAFDARHWVDLGNGASLRLTGSMTLSAWIKPRAFPPDDAAIISSRSSDEFGYQLDVTVDEGPRMVGFKLADPDGRVMARYGRTTLVADRWYHVAGVYDATARTLDVYVNGQPDNGCLIGRVAGHQHPAAGHVFAGRRAGLRGYEFIGTIDEAEVQSRPLAATEVQAQFAAAAHAVDATSPPAARDVKSTREPACPYVRDARLPRVAGPYVAIGMAVALACAGLWFGLHYEVATLALCLLVGMTSGFWAGAANLRHVWLTALLMLAGGAAMLLAIRKSSPSGPSEA
jgi:hypothetical protein